MLRTLTTHTCACTHTHTHTNKNKNKKPKIYKEILGKVSYTYYLYCGDSVMGVCICPDSLNSTH